MWLLNYCADAVAPYITILFNLLLSNGVVPATFKNNSNYSTQENWRD